MATNALSFGQGDEPVLVLPDWFGGSQYWSDLSRWADLRRYTYAIVDYRGYGRARALTGAYSINEMAADALAVADALGWSRFHLVGHSMGGKAAQLLTTRAPTRLKSITAVTPTPPSKVALDASTRDLLESCESSAESRRIALNAATGGQYGQAFLSALAEVSLAVSEASAFRRYLDAWSNTDIRDDLSVTDISLDVIVGALDPFSTEAGLRAELLPKFSNARLHVLEGCGHYPLIEQPPRTITLIEKVFASQL